MRNTKITQFIVVLLLLSINFNAIAKEAQDSCVNYFEKNIEKINEKLIENKSNLFKTLKQHSKTVKDKNTKQFIDALTNNSVGITIMFVQNELIEVTQLIIKDFYFKKYLNEKKMNNELFSKVVSSDIEDFFNLAKEYNNQNEIFKEITSDEIRRNIVTMVNDNIQMVEVIKSVCK